ncbi:MAG: NAD(P)-dependent oxidoreductase [Xanthomonadales bacterium]|nr:NAD(P)-dependent oxidoreductase [Xanthomonadales bacterium]
MQVGVNKTVGFIGLGAMGKPMAAHLLKAACNLQVWNRTTSVAEHFQAEYVAQDRLHVAANLSTMAADCETIFTCVSADKDLIEIADELLPSLSVNSIICDHSTIAPKTASTLGLKLASVGCHFIDAPVSGGIEGARRGSLVAMVGGDKTIIERISPLLNCYISKISRMGCIGTGQATKALNQIMIAGIAEAVTEALALAEKLKLLTNQLLEVLVGGAAASWFMSHRGQSMLEERFSEGFKLSLLYKDLGICEELARNLDLDLYLLGSAREDYYRLIQTGEGDFDISALIHLKQGRID